MKDDEYLVIPTTESPEQVLIQLVHEFRAPINAIKGHATLILREKVYIQEGAREIHRIAENMEKVQNAVFDYLRAQGTLE